MATEWQTYALELRGGLRSNLSPLQQGINFPGSAIALQNFEPSKEGGYSKILGFTKYDPDIVPGSGPIKGLKVIDDTQILAVRSSDDVVPVTKVYTGNGTGWTLLQTASLNGSKVRFADFNFGAGDNVVFVDGVNKPAVFDSTSDTVTYLTGAPSDLEGADHVAVFKTTVFYANGTKLIFTAPSTYDDFSAANGSGVISIGQPITGLAVFRDNLFVFSRNSIKRVTGSSYADFAMAPVTDKIGCVDPDTIQEVGGDIMYVSSDGVRLLSATDRIGDFGLNIPSDLIAKDSADFLNSSTSFCSVVIRQKAQYRIFAYIASEQKDSAEGLVATIGSNQNDQNVAWSKLKGIKAYVADSRYTEGYKETVIFGNEDGYVYKLESGSSFDEAPIPAIFQTPYFYITDPQIRKTFYRMVVFAKPQGSMDVDVTLSYDFDTPTDMGFVRPTQFTISSFGQEIFLYGQTNAVYGNDPTVDATYGGELYQVYSTNITGSGKTVSIKIEDNTTNPSFTLDAVLLEYRQNDRK